MTKTVLIVGTGAAGKLLYRDLTLFHKSIKVVGFVDDKSDGSNLPILGRISDLDLITKKIKIDELLVAIPSASGNLIRQIMINMKMNRVQIKIVPRSQRVIRLSNVKYEDLKNVGLEDFLGKSFVRQYVEKLSDYYKNKTILVTGGAGSIGSQIVQQLLELGSKKVIVYDNSEYLIFNLDQLLKEDPSKNRCKLIIGNILNSNKLDKVFKKEKPDVVIHAAAYKHVYLMEENVDEAVVNNVQGTKTVVDLVINNQIPKFVFISTDKVVNPSSIMGTTKKICEQYIRHLYLNMKNDLTFNIVRFGNVINSNGSVLPLFEKQINEKKEVTVTHKKVMRFFMSIREASQLVIESTALGHKNTVHVLQMGELLNIYEIARCLIRSKNLIEGVDVKIRITSLRKGEKMVEELYTSKEGEKLVESPIEKVWAISQESNAKNDVEIKVSSLINTAQNKSFFEINRALKSF